MGGKKKGGSRTPGIQATDFKALTAFLGGYLHQDYRVEYKTPMNALQAYCREATSREVGCLRAELERFLAETRGLPFAAVQRLLGREFHSGWLPESRSDLSHWLTVLPGDKSGTESR